MSRLDILLLIAPPHVQDSVSEDCSALQHSRGPRKRFLFRAHIRAVAYWLGLLKNVSFLKDRA
jgi:hypothetical protein